VLAARAAAILWQVICPFNCLDGMPYARAELRKKLVFSFKRLLYFFPKKQFYLLLEQQHGREMCSTGLAGEERLVL